MLLPVICLPAGMFMPCLPRAFACYEGHETQWCVCACKKFEESCIPLATRVARASVVGDARRHGEGEPPTSPGQNGGAGESAIRQVWRVVCGEVRAAWGMAVVWDNDKKRIVHAEWYKAGVARGSRRCDASTARLLGRKQRAALRPSFVVEMSNALECEEGQHIYRGWR